MADTELLILRMELGPQVELSAFAHLVRDLDTLGRFATGLQRRADRAETIYRLGPRRFIEEEDFGPVPPYMLGRSLYQDVVSPRFEAALSSRLAELDDGENATVRLERVNYANPVELVIIAGGLVTIGVMKLIRDWPQRRRLNELAASEYESQIEARRELRKFVVQEITTGQHRLRSDQVQELLTADVEDALLALGDSDLQMLNQPSITGETQG